MEPYHNCMNIEIYFLIIYYLIIMRKTSSNEKTLSVDYSFTITLQPKMYKLEPEIQYDNVVKHIKDKLYNLTATFTVVVENTKNFNIHLHGICNFYIGKKNCIKEWYTCWRNDPYVGFTNIKQCTDVSGWLEYMSKDMQTTYETLDRRPLIYDYLEYFTSKDRALYGCQW